MTCQISEFLIVNFSFFCFLRYTPRSRFLTDRDLYAKMRVFAQGGDDRVSRQYLTTFESFKTSPKLAGTGIFKHKRRKGKISHISRKPINRLTQNFLLFFGPPTQLHGWSDNAVLQIQDDSRRQV